MREMKDSGVTWIGEIPKEWDCSRIKDIKANIKYAIVDGPFGSAISTDDYVDDGVPLIRIVNIKQPGLTIDNIRYITEEHAKMIQRSRVYKNDIIFAKTGATVGKCGINDKFEYAILSSSCVKISIDNSHNTKYFYYLFFTDQFNEALRNACNGTTRDTINLKPFGNIDCCIPEVYEQSRIADFLDSKTAQIDNLIANQQSQIEKLKAYKQSLITEVVTKGLDPTVPMKDSGVEWIGEIPENWIVIRQSNLFKNRTIKGHGDATVLSVYRDWGVIPKDSRDDNWNVTSLDTDSYKYIESGDLVINKMKAWSGSLAISDYSGIVSPAYYTCKVNYNLVDKRFIHHYLRNRKIVGVYEKYSAGMRVGQWDLAIKDFLGIEIAIPKDKKEQELIAKHLDCKCQEVDRLISIKQQKIEKLNQYKKSLIYEYVTGKKEVI